MKVLLIDERPGTLEFFGESIFNFGYKTGIATCKDDIINMLSTGQYEVILTNGGSRGLDVVQHIKSKDPSVYVICMTESPKNQSESYTGADLYLQRPLMVSRLRQVINDKLYH
ncbi:MAG: hypothetical protein JXA41_04930 [Deltaproteobacteria bacterium]|nr:hypothetical protein [Deltaproteobacteria bacterium]